MIPEAGPKIIQAGFFHLHNLRILLLYLLKINTVYEKFCI